MAYSLPSVWSIGGDDEEYDEEDDEEQSELEKLQDLVDDEGDEEEDNDDDDVSITQVKPAQPASTTAAIAASAAASAVAAVAASASVSYPPQVLARKGKPNMTAYMFFSQEVQPKQRLLYPNEKLGQISKNRVSPLWKQCKNKRKYEDLAAADKIRWNAEKAAAPPPPSKSARKRKKITMTSTIVSAFRSKKSRKSPKTKQSSSSASSVSKVKPATTSALTLPEFKGLMVKYGVHDKQKLSSKCGCCAALVKHNVKEKSCKMFSVGDLVRPKSHKSLEIAKDEKWFKDFDIGVVVAITEINLVKCAHVHMLGSPFSGIKRNNQYIIHLAIPIHVTPLALKPFLGDVPSKNVFNSFVRNEYVTATKSITNVTITQQNTVYHLTPKNCCRNNANPICCSGFFSQKASKDPSFCAFYNWDFIKIMKTLTNPGSSSNSSSAAGSSSSSSSSSSSNSSSGTSGKNEKKSDYTWKIEDDNGYFDDVSDDLASIWTAGFKQHKASAASRYSPQFAVGYSPSSGSPAECGFPFVFFWRKNVKYVLDFCDPENMFQRRCEGVKQNDGTFLFKKRKVQLVQPNLYMGRDALIDVTSKYDFHKLMDDIKEGDRQPFATKDQNGVRVRLDADGKDKEEYKMVLKAMSKGWEGNFKFKLDWKKVKSIDVDRLENANMFKQYIIGRAILAEHNKGLPDPLRTRVGFHGTKRTNIEEGGSAIASHGLLHQYSSSSSYGVGPNYSVSALDGNHYDWLYCADNMFAKTSDNTKSFILSLVDCGVEGPGSAGMMNPGFKNINGKDYLVNTTTGAGHIRVTFNHTSSFAFYAFHVTYDN